MRRMDQFRTPFRFRCGKTTLSYYTNYFLTKNSSTHRR